MDKIDLNELEQLAKAATPGPWKIGKGYAAKFVMTYEDIPVRRLVSVTEGNEGTCDLARGWDESCANAAYIVAACNHAPELVARVRELEAENRTLGERLCETEHDLTEALDKKEDLERRVAELAHENSNQKRVIQMLEYRVLDLKGQPIPMEPRQFIPSSNRSNAKESGE